MLFPISESFHLPGKLAVDSDIKNQAEKESIKLKSNKIKSLLNNVLLLHWHPIVFVSTMTLYPLSFTPEDGS